MPIITRLAPKSSLNQATFKRQQCGRGFAPLFAKHAPQRRVCTGHLLFDQTPIHRSTAIMIHQFSAFLRSQAGSLPAETLPCVTHLSVNIAQSLGKCFQPIMKVVLWGRTTSRVNTPNLQSSKCIHHPIMAAHRHGLRGCKR